MPYTTGTTTGAKNFITALLNFCAGTQYTQNIGTGNGASQVHGFTLSNTPVAKGQARLQFEWQGQKYRIYDNGEGIWDHPLITASSINYASGVSSITTSADSGESLDILYCVGKNGGEEGRDWLVLLDQKTRDNVGAEPYGDAGIKEVVLKNSGVSYKESIFGGLRHYQYPAATLWGYNLNCYFQFDEDNEDWNDNSALTGKVAYDGLRESWTLHPNFSLNDDQVAYWLFSTKQFICGIVRVAGTVYSSFFIGHGRRFSSPLSYHNPLIAVGSNYGIIPFNNTGVTHKFIAEPAPTGYAYFVVDPLNNYRFTSDIKFIPMHDFVDAGTIAKTTTNKVLRSPVQVFDVANDGLLFDLDGVFVCPTQGLTAEDDFTDGGDTFHVFQDVHRTDYKSYLCLLEQ